MLLFDPSRAYVKAELTTNHPRSSYGLPVLVLEDGAARGTAETSELVLVNATAEERAGAV